MTLLTLMILLLFVFVLLGMDIAFSVGAASLIYILATQFSDRPINPVLFAQELTAGVDSFALLAIPMFIFAGEPPAAAHPTDHHAVARERVPAWTRDQFETCSDAAPEGWLLAKVLVVVMCRPAKTRGHHCLAAGRFECWKTARIAANEKHQIT